MLMKEHPKEISQLVVNIRNKPKGTYIAKVLLIEAYKHLCIMKGYSHANSALTTFYRTFPVNFINLSNELIAKAGKLKCQHRAKLSYNDCVAIAIALQEKALFHTTEKNLPAIPHLRVKTYNF